MNDSPRRSRRPVIPALALVAMGTVLALHFSPATAAAAATGNPAVTVSPAPSNGRFADGATVRVAIAANSLFTPLSRVVILECADPGGDVAHLPTSISSCDENTVQGDTTVVAKDGSFAESSYTMYTLPSAALGEQANAQPVCSPTSQCVLFVGENQNDFTQPKTFSKPFSMATGTAAATPVPAVSASTVPPVPAGASAAVSLSATTLAFTGTGTGLVLLGVTGMLLMFASLVITRRLRQTSR